MKYSLSIGSGIAVDTSGKAYVTGYTESPETSFPVINGPDLTYNRGSCHVFVAKISARISMLGCPMVAYGNGLAVDFGTAGLYYYNGSSWSQTSTNNPEWLTTYNGNLAADFSTYSLYSYNGSAWSQISTADPDN